MIVPMKKVALIVQSKDAEKTIEKLGMLGVVHIEHQRFPKGKGIDAVQNDIERVEKAIDVLNKAAVRKKSITQEKKLSAKWKRIARHVVDLNDRLNRLQEYARIAKNSVKKWESWGDFNPERVKELSEKNIYVRLYRIPIKAIKEFPDSVVVKKISVVKGVVNCAVISREKINLPLKELALPKTGLNRARHRLVENEMVRNSIKDQLERCIPYKSGLEEIKKILKKELEFQEARDGMGESGKIVYLAGYAPHNAQESLLETAKEEKWGIQISDPSPDDRVPTLIRNPRWVSIIAPVFKMIEVVPGYHELDISLWFLLFLSVFFGMLIGDAGYGAIFFALTLFMQLKLGKKTKSKGVFFLFYLFSSCAIAWGVLTGTFFGQEWLPQSVKPLMPVLRSSKDVQALCFLIGTLHLSIAHLWRAITKLPSSKALADMGWVSVLCGAFFLAKTLILGEHFPHFAKWFFIVGPMLVVFFTNLNLNKNILKGIGSGFGNLLLNFVNSFTDVVSYIRLFAVGLATVAIADAFNKMALGIGFNSVLTGLATALILLLGHTLNILLGPLAVLVHGVRLNVLEFCSHVDIKWSGFSYKPLKAKGD